MRLKYAFACMAGGLFCGLLIILSEQARTDLKRTPQIHAYRVPPVGRGSGVLRVSVTAAMRSKATNLPARTPSTLAVAGEEEDPFENGFQNPTTILDLVNARPT
eukprot:jgi/Botrbrau1/2392/Bobra.0395s0024.1